VRLLGPAPAGLDSKVCAVLAPSDANKDDGSNREKEDSRPDGYACDGCCAELHGIGGLILRGWIDDFDNLARKDRVA
jgi:hypothetical protein